MGDRRTRWEGEEKGRASGAELNVLCFSPSMKREREREGACVYRADAEAHIFVDRLENGSLISFVLLHLKTSASEPEAGIVEGYNRRLADIDVSLSAPSVVFWRGKDVRCQASCAVKVYDQALPVRSASRGVIAHCQKREPHG